MGEQNFRGGGYFVKCLTPYLAQYQILLHTLML